MTKAERCKKCRYANSRISNCHATMNASLSNMNNTQEKSRYTNNFDDVLRKDLKV